ncbi:MAG: hypothetical protein M3R38_11315 [Actinomycetota bacterium]|nr:hypothetical protein [Actinomycetota bacterium]
MGERRLPLVEAPVALVTPRTARMLVNVWSGLERTCREKAQPVPAEMADLIEACRRNLRP